MDDPIDLPLSQTEVDDLLDHLISVFSEAWDGGYDDDLAPGTLNAIAGDFLALHNAITNHNSPIPTDWS